MFDMQEFLDEVGLDIDELNDDSEIGIEDDSKTLPDMMHEYECNLITDALDACNQEKQAASELLGINRTTLSEKCKRYGI